MTTRLGRLRMLAAPAAIAAVAFAAPVPAQAATVSFTNPSCSSFTFTDLGGGTYSVLCNLPTVPVCTVTASSLTPTTGASITLTANCSGNPFGWLWTGTATACSTTSPMCSDTQSVAGAKTYTVFGGNAVGHGPVASVTVNWSQPTTPPTGCTVARTVPASGTLPQAGGAIELNGSCAGGGTVTAWEWRKNGATTTAQTTARYTETLPANTGTSSITYSYEGRACAGGSCAAWTTPPVTVAVSGSVATGECSNYTDVRLADIPWGAPGYYTRPSPTLPYQPTAGVGFARETTFVGRFVVPVGATSPGDNPGVFSGVEYDGSPTERIMTLSTQPCDFRGWTPGSPTFPVADPSGAAGPLAWAGGFYPNGKFLLSGDPPGFPAKPLLTPGQTYYLNIRTVRFNDGGYSCPLPTCDMLITVNPPL